VTFAPADAWRFRGRRRVWGGFTAWCPVCSPREPSLWLAEQPTGEAIVTCLSGCSQEAILGAVGILAANQPVALNAAGKQQPEHDAPAVGVPQQEPPGVPVGAPRGSVAAASAFLRDLLATGPLGADQIRDAARRRGIAERTLKRAKARLGVGSVRRGGGWFWLLSPQEGQPADDNLRPAPQEGQSEEAIHSPEVQVTVDESRPAKSAATSVQGSTNRTEPSSHGSLAQGPLDLAVERVAAEGPSTANVGNQGTTLPRPALSGTSGSVGPRDTEPETNRPIIESERRPLRRRDDSPSSTGGGAP
jgi:hypothetical protein